jgi:hypothetical protein
MAPQRKGVLHEIHGFGHEALLSVFPLLFIPYPLSSLYARQSSVLTPQVPFSVL